MSHPGVTKGFCDGREAAGIWMARRYLAIAEGTTPQMGCSQREMQKTKMQGTVEKMVARRIVQQEEVWKSLALRLSCCACTWGTTAWTLDVWMSRHGGH